MRQQKPGVPLQVLRVPQIPEPAMEVQKPKPMLRGF
jgi:hypothetical protein